MVGAVGITGGGIIGGAIIIRIDVVGSRMHHVGNGKVVAHAIKSVHLVSRGPDNNDTGNEENHAG